MSPLAICLFCSYFAILMAKDLSNSGNYCLKGKYHKEAPGPESSVFEQCTPWQNRSCCTQNATVAANDLSLYRFNYSHCGPLSEACKKHFVRDQCFYECSPNVGPWVVNETLGSIKSRKERFNRVPLCKSDCDTWFADCKDDRTCARNWITELAWNGTENCSQNGSCITIEKMYGNAKDFCEQVFDHSWEYTETENCMKMWFNGTEGNPNDAVAAKKVKEMAGAAAGEGSTLSSQFLHILFCFYGLFLGVTNLIN